MERLAYFRAALKNLFQRMEVDRAVFFNILSKTWSLFAGPVAALLIAIKFTPEVQGYYFTFTSLLVLQIFVELGFGVVIIQFASHEWSKLNLNKAGYIAGDKEALSKLISLAKISLKWFSLGAIIVMAGLSIGGFIFFSQAHNSTGIRWLSPWLALSLFTGIAVFLVPVWSLLEGCNQIVRLYSYRFWQGLFSSIFIWLAILLNAGLWALVVGNGVTAVSAGVFLLCKYKNFLKTLLFSYPGPWRIQWRKDILPMQWRIAVSWISGYFAFFIFTPVLFRYYGPVIAGQFGMTWNLSFAIGTISTAWLNPNIPRFGIFIAQRKYKDLDCLFFRITKIVAAVTIILAVLFWFLVYLLNRFKFPLAYRLLSPLPTGILLLAQVVLFVSVPFSSYLRAHKREPLLFVSLAQGVLTALSTLILGRYYSVLGMVIGYLSVNAIVIPIAITVWYYCRNRWHRQGYTASEALGGNISVNEALT